MGSKYDRRDSPHCLGSAALLLLHHVHKYVHRHAHRHAHRHVHRHVCWHVERYVQRHAGALMISRCRAFFQRANEVAKPHVSNQRIESAEWLNEQRVESRAQAVRAEACTRPSEPVCGDVKRRVGGDV